MPAGEPVVGAPTTWTPTTADAPRRAAGAARRSRSTEPAAYVLPLHRRDDESGLGQRRLAAAPRAHRAAGRRFAGRAAAAAGLDQLAAAARRRPSRPAGPPRRPAADRTADAADAPSSTTPTTAPTTALVAEVRDGLLYVFLPPTEELEHFVDLIARVEAAAAKVDCPVVHRGLRPAAGPAAAVDDRHPRPRRHRGQRGARRPASPSSAHQLETLYEEARQARLSTESFDVDGTHGGTGGGNHITLGGITPADSPLLRRPDLLVSLLTYWQRHPSLSYLFSGRFIGTTSQAPRVDEGRAEALYELEIAFAEIARLDRRRTAPPSRG